MTIKIAGVKYDKKTTLSMVMRKAHHTFKNNYSNLTFSESLKRAWVAVKLYIIHQAKINANIKTVSYADYKNKYRNCKTIMGSYDARKKTIKVDIIAVAECFCGCECYGDCTLAMGY